MAIVLGQSLVESCSMGCSTILILYFEWNISNTSESVTILLKIKNL